MEFHIFTCSRSGAVSCSLALYIYILFLCGGSTSAVTCVPTGITANVLASQRRRPRRWTTTSVWSVNEARKAAQRSCTASVRHHTTSPSKELR